MKQIQIQIQFHANQRAKFHSYAIICAHKTLKKSLFFFYFKLRDSFKTLNDNRTYLSLLIKTFHTHHFFDGKPYFLFCFCFSFESGYSSAKKRLHFHFWHHCSFHFIEVWTRRGASQSALRSRCCRCRPRRHVLSHGCSQTSYIRQIWSEKKIIWNYKFILHLTISTM